MPHKIPPRHKAAITGRADVRCQGHRACLFCQYRLAGRALSRYARAGEETRPKDVGDQALIRGLVTAEPSVRPRLSLSYCGRHLAVATTHPSGAPLPRPRLHSCTRTGFCAARRRRNQLAGASLATAHMNAASSRATAVTATVDFLPLAESARKRAQRRLCAFHAMSRTAGVTRCS